MTALLLGFAGLVGLAVGSFLTVVAARVPAGESLVHPRSRCPGCRAAVRARDNVPVLSWLRLRGRCRACRAPIPFRYPLIEAATGGLFVLLAWRFGPSPALPAYLYLAAVGVALSAIDLQIRRLPDRLTLPSYAVGLVLLGAASLAGHQPGALVRAVLAMAVAYALFFGLALLGGMGFGDVTLAGVLGLYLGWLGWGAFAVGLFAAFFIGGVVSVGLLAAGRAKRKTKVPFGPFLVAGALVAVVAGQPIAAAWLGAGR